MNSASSMLLSRNSRFNSKIPSNFIALCIQPRQTAVQSAKPRTISTGSYNMATPSRIHLTPKDTGLVHFKSPTEETAAKTSQLLQENHDV